MTPGGRHKRVHKRVHERHPHLNTASPFPYLASLLAPSHVNHMICPLKSRLLSPQSNFNHLICPLLALSLTWPLYLISTFICLKSFAGSRRRTQYSYLPANMALKQGWFYPPPPLGVFMGLDQYLKYIKTLWSQWLKQTANISFSDQKSADARRLWAHTKSQNMFSKHGFAY